MKNFQFSIFQPKADPPRADNIQNVRKSLVNWIIGLLGYSPPIRVGLTLIELLIVMSLISILAVALWGNFFTSLTKGRDSRRKQDLDAVSKSLELYYNDNRAYPLPTFIQWGSSFAVPNVTPPVVYMQKLPTDPTYPTFDYCYLSDGTYFKIYANLENKNDSKIIPTVSCSSTNYNYGISSPNVTP